jgi:hypothetical protein
MNSDIPVQNIVVSKLLEVLRSRGGRSHPQDLDAQGRTVYMALADRLDLSPEARSSKDGDGRSLLEHHARSARQWAIKNGLMIDTGEWGDWQLSEQGMRLTDDFAEQSES